MAPSLGIISPSKSIYLYRSNIPSPGRFVICLVFSRKNALDPAQHPLHGTKQIPKAKRPALDADSVNEEVDEAVARQKRVSNCLSLSSRKNLQPVGEAKHQKDAKISPLVVLDSQRRQVLRAARKRAVPAV